VAASTGAAACRRNDDAAGPPDQRAGRDIAAFEMDGVTAQQSSAPARLRRILDFDNPTPDNGGDDG